MVSVEMHRHGKRFQKEEGRSLPWEGEWFMSEDVRWDYDQLDHRQREIAQKLKTGEKGTLLVSEVAPVITLGRRTQKSDLTLQAADYSEAGIDLLWTDRGGYGTYHGPGQWVLFPVDRLEKLTNDPRGVKQIICSLLEIALKVGLEYDPTSRIEEGEKLGVWTSRGKFASVGIHVENGVVLHGLSVNGFRTSKSFMGLRPCGLDASMDYLLRELENREAAQIEKAFWGLGKSLVSSFMGKFWV